METIDRYLTPAALAMALVGFCWSMAATDDLQRSLGLVGKVILPVFSTLKLWLWHTLRVRRSGLTEAQFAVREAGGVAGARQQAFRLRAAAWSFIGVPTVVAVWLQISGSSAAAFVAILAMLICTPIAALFFWHARRLFRAAVEEEKR
jgi:hypothetical protein